MWIELDDAFIKELQTVDSSYNEIVLTINTLFDTMFKRQHIVFSSRQLLDKLECWEYISPTNRDFITWIKYNYLSLYACFDIIQHKLFVKPNITAISKVVNGYDIPVKYIYELREAKLLSENEEDAKLFLSIYNCMNKLKKTSNCYDIRLANDSYHGGNVASKLISTIDEQRFAVCFVDSDRDYINGACGSTLRSAKKTLRKCSKDKVIHLKELDVREKENLFTAKMYHMVSNGNNQLLNLLNESDESGSIMRYFDIKDGVKYKDLQNEVWMKHYGPIVDKSRLLGLVKDPNLNLDSKERDKFVCIEGIGDSLCNIIDDVLITQNNCLSEMVHKHGISTTKIDDLKELKESLLDHLPIHLVEEWTSIYALIFGFGCCLSKTAFPVYTIN